MVSVSTFGAAQINDPVAIGYQSYLAQNVAAKTSLLASNFDIQSVYIPYLEQIIGIHKALINNVLTPNQELYLIAQRVLTSECFLNYHNDHISCITNFLALSNPEYTNIKDLFTCFQSKLNTLIAATKPILSILIPDPVNQENEDFFNAWSDQTATYKFFVANFNASDPLSSIIPYYLGLKAEDTTLESEV